jgi:uncharacterized protein YukE
MSLTLSNPVAAYTEKIAQPFDDAAPIVRQIADLYDTSSQELQKNQQTLAATFSGIGANAFADMITKQVSWEKGIASNIRELAGLYETCATDVRLAAQEIEHLIEPFLDVVQWVLDRLTPDIIVQQGESAVHAVFSDMTAQLHREMHDISGFFGSIVHLHFGDAWHDTVDGVEGLGHLGGDVLALVAAVEPILCQWAANVYQAVNWLLNKINGWCLDAADWLLGLSSIADDTAVFVDPNSTTAEKWLAGIDMGLNIVLDIGLFIPGADIFDLAGKGFFSLLEKFGLKELEGQILKFVEKVTFRELREKLFQKVWNIVLRKFIGGKVLPTLVITDPARRAIYEDLLKKFPNVDPNFIAHLVSAKPQITWLSQEQIEKFLLKAQERGDLDNIILLYTYVYRSDRPGLDKLLRDLANGNPTDYQGSLYQLEWIAGHNDEVKAVEVLDSQGRKGPDIVLNDGTFVDVKSYTSKPKAKSLEDQILRYLDDFPDVKNHTIRFVFKSGADGIDQAAIDKIKQRVIDFGRANGVNVEIDLWP